MKRSQLALDFKDTIIWVRETIKLAVVDSIAYPPPPKKGIKYYSQRLYVYNKIVQAKEDARAWFRSLGDSPDGFRLMWDGILLCGGPNISAEKILNRLEEIWKICDADPSRAAEWDRSIRHASVIFGDEDVR